MNSKCSRQRRMSFFNNLDYPRRSMWTGFVHRINVPLYVFLKNVQYNILLKNVWMRCLFFIVMFFTKDCDPTHLTIEHDLKRMKVYVKKGWNLCSHCKIITNLNYLALYAYFFHSCDILFDTKPTILASL